MKKKKQSVRKAPAVGFAWYQANQYELLRRSSLDRKALCAGYEKWRASAEEKFADMARSGLSVVRVYIDVNELVAWCTQHKRPLDAAARADYAAAQLRRPATRTRRGAVDSRAGQ